MVSPLSWLAGWLLHMERTKEPLTQELFRLFKKDPTWLRPGGRQQRHFLLTSTQTQLCIIHARGDFSGIFLSKLAQAQRVSAWPSQARFDVYGGGV